MNDERDVYTGKPKSSTVNNAKTGDYRFMGEDPSIYTF